MKVNLHRPRAFVMLSSLAAGVVAMTLVAPGQAEDSPVAANPSAQPPSEVPSSSERSTRQQEQSSTTATQRASASASASSGASGQGGGFGLGQGKGSGLGNGFGGFPGRGARSGGFGLSNGTGRATGGGAGGGYSASSSRSSASVSSGTNESPRDSTSQPNVQSSKDSRSSKSSQSSRSKSQTTTSSNGASRRVTTVELPTEVVTITESPKKIAVRREDRRVNPPKVHVVSAANVMELQAKHPEAYALYKEHAPDGLATGGGSNPAVGSDATNELGDGALSQLPDENSATRLLKDELRKRRDASTNDLERQAIEQMLREIQP